MPWQGRIGTLATVTARQAHRAGTDAPLTIVSLGTRAHEDLMAPR